MEILLVFISVIILTILIVMQFLKLMSWMELRHPEYIGGGLRNKLFGEHKNKEK